MTIKTIIFDWAGTTVDFGCMTPVYAFQHAFLEKGITLTMDEIRRPMGMSKRDHTATLLALPSAQTQWQAAHGTLPKATDVDAIYARFEALIFEDLAQNSNLKPETLTVVQALKAANYNIGSTTGYTKEMMDVVTKVAAQAGYTPDFIATAEMTANLGRPYPYMIYQNMQHFQAKSVKEVVKVGDTIADIEEGKNAGVYTVAVIIGSSEMGLSLAEYEALSPAEQEAKIQAIEAKFKAAGADLCVRDLTEFLEKLPEI
ncbi:phosphonoacetaldehyde hydrolase [Enterococcus sp. LJL98]